MSDESEFMDLNAQCEEDIHVSNSCSLPWEKWNWYRSEQKFGLQN
jgi:hypothetical protein